MRKVNAGFEKNGRGKYFNNTKKNNPLLNKHKNAEESAKLSQVLQDEPKKDEQEKALPEDVPVENEHFEEANEQIVPTDLGKTTHLVFFKKYDTYQALFEISPKSDITAKDCFSKVVLRIMGWFRKRLGEEAFRKNPKISFLKTDYPVIENFKEFDIEKASDIEGLGFLDVETRYLSSKKAWLFSLEEPDNGQEKSSVTGRAFKTEYFLYLKENSVVFGIRESCREPEDNTEDAKGLRPGIVRDMVFDDDIYIYEYNTGVKNAFACTPIILNGKSKDNCRELYDVLIDSKYRQMPILFVPGEFYENNKQAVDEKTVSYVGYCHMVVWTETCRKLFEQVMENDEFVETAEKGQLILYKTDASGRAVGNPFNATVDSLEMVKAVVHREPLRKKYNFFEYTFKPTAEDLINEKKGKDESRILAEEEQRINEIKELKSERDGYKADNEQLQDRINKLEDDIKTFKSNEALNSQEITKSKNKIGELENTVKKLQEENKRLTGDETTLERNLKAQFGAEKERIRPLLKMPQCDKDVRSNIISWIKDSYNELLVVHPTAEKALMSDDKSIDWHKLCMIIHYIAGYTKYRNEGGVALNSDAAREYDPENSGLKAEPSSSGQGSFVSNKDNYTITVTLDDGTKREEMLDLHVKTGKDASNLIRVYFTYVPELKKSVIGYMPGHLPTRKDSH